MKETILTTGSEVSEDEVEIEKMLENEELAILSGDEDDLGGMEKLREQIGKAHL